MKKKLLAILIATVLLAGLTVPIVNASNVALVALNPIGDIDIQTNIPLTSRDRFLNEDGVVDLNGKVIGLSSYSKSNNAQALQALGDLLIAQFPGVLVVDAGVTDLGSPWNNKTDANYQQWAGLTALGQTVNTINGSTAARGRPLDAVIFGVAD